MTTQRHNIAQQHKNQAPGLGTHTAHPSLKSTSSTKVPWPIGLGIEAEWSPNNHQQVRNMARTYTSPTPSQPKTSSRSPDYKGDGVAMWINDDESGATSVNVNVVGRTTIKASEVPHDVRRTFADGGRTPDFRTHGMSVWFETSRKGASYAKISVAGSEDLYAFTNDNEEAASSPEDVPADDE